MSGPVELKARIQSGDLVAGTMALEFFVPGLPAIAAAAGAEFILLDMEHTGTGFETMRMLCAACRGLSIAPIIRVPTTEYSLIARALDIGAHGVMVPMVNTVEQARLIASCAHYPPAGHRGAAFGIAHDDYLPGDPAEKIARASARTVIIAQIESPQGVENAEAIAAVPGIDVLWVGHFDLSNFMGIPGQFAHPDFDAALRHVGRSARAKGKAAGLMAGDLGWSKRVREIGYSVIAQGIDAAHYQNGLSGALQSLRSF
ncbi:HpcH/HpaI aldolase family protein [Bosea sp. (in: a-proteobacteria)]|uniref:HpcH/HpaI aldolase family protein n=1 Tax=Bosea sp. (in: a-proteobacteria) TaxID=1871050 RepID=UPI002FCAB929